MENHDLDPLAPNVCVTQLADAPVPTDAIRTAPPDRRTSP